MADIFLSYARQDREAAELVKSLLEQAGLKVFFDVEGLDGGDSFPDVLDREVKAARVVVGLWSPHSLSRPWVRTECMIGKDRGVLLPAAIAKLDPLLDVPAAFYGIQHIDLSDFNGDPRHLEWTRLVKSLARLLKRNDLLAAIPTHVRPLRPSPAKKISKGVVMSGALLALLAAAALGALALQSFLSPTTASKGPDLVEAGTSEPVPSAAMPSTPVVVSDVAEAVTPTPPVLPASDRLIAEVRKLNFGAQEFYPSTAITRLGKTYSFKDLEVAAKKDIRSKTLLAFATEDGALGATKNQEVASRLFNEACDAKEPLACLHLSTEYFTWDGEVDKEKHAEGFLQALTACNANFAQGCFYAGRYEERVDRYESALRYYESACEDGVLWGCTHAGRIAYKIFNNSAKGKTLLSKACEGGNDDACFQLVDFYLDGPREWQDTTVAEARLEAMCGSKSSFSSDRACRRLNDVRRNSEYQRRKTNKPNLLP